MTRWPLVRVTWVDSHGPHGWTYLKDAVAPHDLTCESVGWLIDDGEDRITIASSVSAPAADNPACDGILTIPKCAITACVTLVEAQ